jgi:DNA-binding MarR family transcriptional regulator
MILVKQQCALNNRKFGMSINLEKRFGHLVADVARLFGTQFDQQARGRISLPRAQCRVIVYLSSFGEMNQAQLADLLGVTPMTVVRMLDRLEEGGWIRRLDDPNDRRAVRVVATAKAERLVGPIMAVSDEITAQATQGLTAQEKTTLINLLSKVKANIVGQ